MRRVPVIVSLAVVSLVGLAACTARSVPTAAGRPADPARGGAKQPAGEAASPTAPPQVRMFAGVDSAPGAVVQLCRDKRCTGRPLAPPRLLARSGAVVTFAVGAAPEQAALDITGPGARRVSLGTGTLMAAPGTLAVGAHRLTLLLRWGTTTATYAWEATVLS